mgnify:CR=1 FL=1
MEYMLIGQQGWLMFGELPESLETMARILKNAYSSGELQDCIPLACIPVFMNTITEWSSTWYGYVVRNLLFNVRNYRVWEISNFPIEQSSCSGEDNRKY